jgi:hypothetical protein
MEQSTVESIRSDELEGFLREDFYDGRSSRQLVAQPLLYGGAAWVVLLYLAFMMREEISDEWRRLRRAVDEPEWGWDSGEDWTVNHEGIATRIQSRIAHWKSRLNWADLRARIGRHPKVVQYREAGQAPPVSPVLQPEQSTPQQVLNPPSSHPPKARSQGHTIFPRSSPSNAAHSQPKPWDESEWID